jgi:hypothetical protein
LGWPIERWKQRKPSQPKSILAPTAPQSETGWVDFIQQTSWLQAKPPSKMAT